MSTIATNTARRTVTLRVNGEQRSATVEGRRTLAEMLREDLGLTGTHLGCEHGVCGSCTVVVDGRAVRSCLTLAIQTQGSTVETVESLGEGGELGLIQQAMWEQHGFQCAFCSPGFLMTIKCLLEANPNPTMEEIKEELSGNLCRCTGYASIVAGVVNAVTKLKGGGSDA